MSDKAPNPLTRDARKAEPGPEDPAMGMNYLQDDPDRQKDGLHARPLMEEYENVAHRDDLIRQLDDTVVAARAWAQEGDHEDAGEIVELLESAWDLMGRSTEATDEETHMDFAGDPPKDR